MIDGENPFIILARITVKEGLVNDYLAIAEEADKAVERVLSDKATPISKCRDHINL